MPNPIPDKRFDKHRRQRGKTLLYWKHSGTRRRLPVVEREWYGLMRVSGGGIFPVISPRNGMEVVRRLTLSSDVIQVSTPHCHSMAPSLEQYICACANMVSLAPGNRRLTVNCVRHAAAYAKRVSNTPALYSGLHRAAPYRTVQRSGILFQLREHHQESV